MRTRTQKRIQSYFEKIETAVFWPSDLLKILGEHRGAWEAWDVSNREMTNYLLKTSLVETVEFASPKYPSIIRYTRGQPSYNRLALSLKRASFLCHHSALVLHGLAVASNTVFANQEQSKKPESSGLTQAAIRLAFSNQQRQSNYRFQHDEFQYILVSGKNTGRAGVVQLKTPEGEEVDSTDLERTLIDIVVRPAYAGGLEKIASVYEAVFRRVDLDHLIDLLGNLNYLYPYAQSIGFLLQRAGRSEKDLKGLENLRSEFDFFLDYGLKEPSYDEKWRLYYPGKIGPSIQSVDPASRPEPPIDTGTLTAAPSLNSYGR